MSGTIGDARKRVEEASPMERMGMIVEAQESIETLKARLDHLLRGLTGENLETAAEVCKAAGYEVCKMRRHGDYGLDNGRGGFIVGGPPVESVPETRIPLWVVTEKL